VTDAEHNQVYQAENGQFIAFWRGSVVHKFDGTLRYFGSEQAARDFLTRREGISSSIIGAVRTNGGKAPGSRLKSKALTLAGRTLAAGAGSCR
jgi:hypothetical protein